MVKVLPMTKTDIQAAPNALDITITREFAAPPALVYRAYSEPDLLKKWMGTKQYEMTFEFYELRHGGGYRHVHKDNDGNVVFAFRGVFHGEPSVENGIGQTFEWEGLPGHVNFERLTFEEIEPGRTLFRNHSVYLSQEDRDGMLESMESGVVEGFEQLDELLETLKF